MDLDYYAILEIEPSASLEQIKVAYRKMALKCHPDRGGNHRQMVAVNEAWEILSDPHLRAAYDSLDRSSSGAQTDSTWAETSRDARNRAKEYPRKWAEFEAFMNTIGRDFSDAEFSSYKFGPISLPKSTNSISGWCFIFIGGIVGLPLTASLMETEFIKNNDKPIFKIYAALPILIGAWLGVLVHCVIGGAIKSWFTKSSAQTSDSGNSAKAAEKHSTEKRIVVCVNCGQKLRIPIVTSKLKVTCTSCRQAFDQAGDG